MTTQDLKAFCRDLLAENKVDMIIGYGEKNRRVIPIFITQPNQTDQLVWNDQCIANLTTYLTRKQLLQGKSRIGIIVKGCDARTLKVLETENQINRQELIAIGMFCNTQHQPKCIACDAHTPLNTDHIIEAASAESSIPAREEAFQELEAFMKKSPEERLAYWKTEFARCLKCYACRQVCPLCYCERCIVDKNRPTVIDTSATLKGNFAWHITRAFHLASRCIGCDECTRVCPVGINLRLLNLATARAAEEAFEHRSGVDDGAVIGSYKLQDKEDFIK